MKRIAPKLFSLLRIRVSEDGTRYSDVAVVLGEDVARELRAVLAVASAAKRHVDEAGLRLTPTAGPLIDAIARLDEVSR